MNKEKEKLLIQQELIGLSVTQRIKVVTQPKGGYINPKELNTISLGEGIDKLNPIESITPGLVGIAVDYLTRFMLGAKIEDAFYISIEGSKIVNEEKKARKLAKHIKGLDEKSVLNAVKLVGYDVCFRAGVKAFRPIDNIEPDSKTIENIITMVNRSLEFFKQYGPKVLDGFTFTGGYTKTVSAGDGDFTTNDTLWDFKVSKSPIKKEHTLQILMYWRLGVHSIHPEFKTIKYLGIYNPRLNTVSRIAISDIPLDIINEVDKDVIGY